MARRAGFQLPLAAFRVNGPEGMLFMPFDEVLCKDTRFHVITTS